MRSTMFNQMEDRMKDSGGFIFNAFEPYLAIHHAGLKPVIRADGHPDTAQFTRD